MSFEVISDTTPVARKQHRCVWCGEPILKGQKHFHQVGKMYGDIQANRWHFECFDAAKLEDIEDGFIPHENERPELKPSPDSPTKTEGT